MEREHIRTVLADRNRLPVRRKNAAGTAECAQLVLSEREDGAVRVAVAGARDTGEVTGLLSRAHIAVWRAGLAIAVDRWDEFAVVSR